METVSDMPQNAHNTAPVQEGVGGMPGVKEVKGLRTFFGDSAQKGESAAGDDRVQKMAELLKRIPAGGMATKAPGVPGMASVQKAAPAETKEERAARIVREEAAREAKRREEEARKAREDEEAKRRKEEQARAEAEKARREEEERQREEERQDKERRQEIVRLGEEMRKKNIAQEGAEAAIAPLEAARSLAIAEKERVEAILRPIADEESRIEAEIAASAAASAVITDFTKRQEAERAQWVREDARRAVEKKKWAVEEELARALAAIAEKDASIALARKEADRIGEEIQKLGHEKSMCELRVRLREIAARKNELEERWVDINDKKESAEAELAPIVAREAKAEEDKRKAEVEERSAQDFVLRKQAEERRQAAEDVRRKIAEERWAKESAREEFVKAANALRPAYQAALAEEESITRELASLEGVKTPTTAV